MPEVRLVAGPSTVALLPRREHGERPPIEIRKPPQPSKWRLVMLGVIVGVGVVVGASSFRPDPCGGTNFESENWLLSSCPRAGPDPRSSGPT